MKTLWNRAISLALAGTLCALNFNCIAYAAEPYSEDSSTPSPFSLNSYLSDDAISTSETATSEVASQETALLDSVPTDTFTIPSERELTVLSDSPNAISLFSGGTGTEVDPYLISSSQELNDFAVQVNAGETFSGKYIALADDIYLNEVSDFSSWSSTSAPSNVWPGLNNFAGTIDGRNHAIIGLYMCRNEENTGFINTTDPQVCASIKNLVFKNCYVHGTSNVGAIFGSPSYASIENCAVHGIVEGSGDNVGGFVGYFESPGKRGLQIQNSVSNTTVSGSNSVGGFVGRSGIGNHVGIGDELATGTEKILFSDCINYGSITGSGNNVGGFVGYLFRSMNSGGVSISNIGNEGLVEGNTNVGGICGFLHSEYKHPAQGTVPLNCVYNIGQITGYTYVGGICGGIKVADDSNVAICNTYSQGNVRADLYHGGGASGGLVGGVTSIICGSLTIEKGYYSGLLTGVGVKASVARKDNDAYVETKIFYWYYSGGNNSPTVGNAVDTFSCNESQMHEQSTYKLLDFSSEWKMGADYPYFAWQDTSVLPSKPTSAWDKSDFTIGRDNFNFMNSGSDFFTSDEYPAWHYKYNLKNNTLTLAEKWSIDLASLIYKYDVDAYKTNYQISDEAITRLIQDEKATSQDSIISHRNSLWSGSCYGMAAVAAMRYTLKNQFPLYDDSHNTLENLYSVSKPSDGNDNTVSSSEDLINYYHLMQFLPSVRRYESNTVESIHNNYALALQQFVAKLSNTSEPLLFNLSKKDGETIISFGHTVCLLGILGETQDYYTISVYDPNCTELTKLLLYKVPQPKDFAFRISYSGSQTTQGSSTKYDIGYPSVPVEILSNKASLQSSSTETLSQLSILTGQDSCVQSQNYNLTYTNKSIQIVQNMTGPFAYCNEFDESANGWLYYWLNGDTSSSNFTISLTPRDENLVAVKLSLGDWSFVVAGDSELQINVDAANNSVSASSSIAGFKSIRITRNTWSDENCPWNTIVVDTNDAKQLTLTPNEKGVTVDSDNLKHAVVGGRKELVAAARELNTTETTVTVLNPNSKNSDEVEIELPHTIHSTSQGHGNIFPSGDVNVAYKQNQTFLITPEPGYIIEDVLVDGVSIGAVSQYKFTSVTNDHTISVTFKAISPAVTVSPAPATPAVTATPAPTAAPATTNTPTPTVSPTAKTPPSTATQAPIVAISNTAAPSTTPTREVQSPSDAPSSTTIPKTSDTSSPFLLISISILSFTALYLLVLHKKHSQK